MSEEKERSWLWILLPVFFFMPGGIISYFALKDSDQRLSKMSLYLGAAVTMGMIPIIVISSIMMAGMFFMDGMPFDMYIDESYMHEMDHNMEQDMMVDESMYEMTP